MLFHTWPFLVFLLAVLPVFFLLRRTRLWLPWLTVASYFFYGWWNPYYLGLVFYITVLDFFLVALMDRCPLDESPTEGRARLTLESFDDPVLKGAFIACALVAAGCLGVALAGPATLRPALIGLGLIVSL